ncbi:response regulator [Flavobacterium sp.]|uniref:response regulator n=1 Tax=Flavobacterium sp. TaxID=239 RepID=UPI0037531259
MSRKKSILIVEDELIISANIAMQLVDLGYEVIGKISRTDEVLPSIRDCIPDIILMDINLKSDIDGIELAKLIHKENKIPIIF